jgi:transcriptional regulator with XRE-family HTH domain
VTLKAQRPLHPAYPKTLKTLGDHLRKRRLDLSLLQRDVARKIGVDKTTIHNWETNQKNPSLHFIPRIIKFIGYFPFEPSADQGQAIRTYRKAIGITRKIMAKELRIDPSTLGKWEKGKGRPSNKLLEKVYALFTSVPPSASDAGK